ncbi:MAG: alpha/beta-hydrolase family protein [Paracoccaceae bacterium]
MDKPPSVWQRGTMRRPLSDLPLLTPPSALGLILGALCFVASLTPSLIPRAGLVQGVLAGACFAAGYAIGMLAVMVWRLFGLPLPAGKAATAAWRWSAVLAAAGIVWGLSRVTGWQDALHRAMDLPAVESARPLVIAVVSAVVAGALIFLGRLFRRSMMVVAGRLTRIMPERLALLVGFAVAVLLFNFVGNDLIVRWSFTAFDASYRAVDAAIPAETAPPADPLKTGSAASLIPWQGLGAEGRNRVLDPLDAAAIAAIAGAPAKEPLRIYAGLGSADGPRALAKLALDEAIRVGAFDRGTLVIATPTGTGWMDPAAMLPLEVLTRGDVATISVQYSYLPSWLALLADPDYGAETARAVFAEIHGYWHGLPAEHRPKLYLFGLSLGSLNSDLSADFYDMIADPYQGALWVGPPFASRSWAEITAGRVAGTPAWLPRFRDGSVVRFMNQTEMPDAGLKWGPLRIVYLQYASDPIVFFAPSTLWREPDWMRAPRGPDVIPQFRWLPVVTLLQLGFDVITATTTPAGHGHVYAGGDYLRAWQALLSPEGWDEAGLARLRAALAARGL